MRLWHHTSDPASRITQNLERVSIVSGGRSVQIETAVHLGAETSFSGVISSFLKHELQPQGKVKLGHWRLKRVFISNLSL